MPPCDELLEFLRHLLEPAAYEKAQAMVRGLTDTSSTEDPPAMDSRPVYAMDSRDAFTRMNDLRNAEREVAPVVGEILGMDSASAVFREALTRMGVTTRDLHPSALPVMFRSAKRGNVSVRPAMDGRRAATFATKHPEIARIRVLG